jgi:hypothetical protein
MTSTIRVEDTALLFGSNASPCVGHFYLDVPKGSLHCLNDAARRLREMGVPLTAIDPAVATLRSTEGGAVRGDQMPLSVAAGEGRRVEVEFVLPRPGQPDCLLQWSASPLKDADGRVGAVIASVVCLPPAPDWPALAGLAHDLRTPLQTLSLSMQILEFQTLPDADRRQALERLNAAARRAQQIARELLEWCAARGAKGRGPQLDWFALEPLLLEVVTEQRPAAAQKNLILGVTPAAVRGWQIYTDRGRLARILANLLVNAVRYTPADGRVNLGAAWEDSAGGRSLVLNVRDTGDGISPHEQECIFHPFERGQAGRDSDATGSGVGLAVVDRLTQELGLKCEVHSESGRGSQFRVLVPQKFLRSVPQGTVSG